MEKKQYVYLFNEGNASMKNLLGGKGANLSEMTILGIPVPQGFTVTTEACNKYYEDDKKISQDIIEEIENKMSELEKITGKKFGSLENPLLVSVRSGARVSMPGMMDTILNLGLNDESVEAMAKLTNNPRFAYDSYRRFIQMFADVVMGVEKRLFEDLLDEVKEEKGYKIDTDLTAEDLNQQPQQRQLRGPWRWRKRARSCRCRWAERQRRGPAGQRDGRQRPDGRAAQRSRRTWQKRSCKPAPEPRSHRMP